jgi:hypothetical protein
MFLEMHCSLRRLVAASLVFASLVCGAPALPVTVEYTNDCENDIGSADDSLIQAGFQFVYDHRDEVFDHIDASRAAGNPFGYTLIATRDRDQWKDRVEDMAAGRIDIDCHFNPQHNRCTNQGPTLLGYTNNVDFLTGFVDRVHVCVDNVRSVASTPVTCGATGNGSATAIMASLIAHELMHHVDGFANHGPDGLTNPCNLDSQAETIGVAIEHLALTPELDVEIDSVEIEDNAAASGQLHITVEATVTNSNSLADLNLVAMSNNAFNVSTTLRLLSDGVRVQDLTVLPLTGVSSRAYTFEFDVDAYDPDNAVYDLEVRADATGLIAELDEGDNSDTHTLSTRTDLSIDVEVASTPIEHRFESHPDLDPFLRVSWYEITYRATVRNLSMTLSAPAADVQLKHRDPWTDSGILVITTEETPLLGPGESAELLFSLDVPARSTFGSDELLGPSLSFSVTFTVDPGRDSVHDSNRDNNSVVFVINEDYWKPDYVLTQSWVIFGPLSATLRYVVRNVGPVDADVDVQLATGELAEEWTAMFLRTVEPLAVGESVTLSSVVDIPDCETVEYSVEVDPFDALDESDEDNNSILYSLGENCDDPFLGDLVDRIDRELGSAHWDINEEGGGILTPLGPGPDDDGGEWLGRNLRTTGGGGLPADFEIRYHHFLILTRDHFALVSQPTSFDVTPLRRREGPIEPPVEEPPVEEPLEPRFRRGDVNGDQKADISDSIKVLDWLFLGGRAPLCEDAADFNDDGKNDVSDAVAGLNFLFNGGSPPPPPAGRCGRDPTNDSLRCESSCASGN